MVSPDEVRDRLSRLVGEEVFDKAFEKVKKMSSKEAELYEVTHDPRISKLPNIHREKDEFGTLVKKMWKKRGYNIIDLMNDDVLFEHLDRIGEVSHDIQVCRVKGISDLADFYIERLSQLFHEFVIMYSVHGNEKAQGRSGKYKKML